MSDKELKIRAGVEGADEIGRAADKALTPWETKARSAGKAVGDAFQGVASDIIRTVTVANAISFGQAMESANRYRQEVGRLSATNGPVGQLRTQIENISRLKLVSESEVISSTRGLGRMAYDARGAQAAIGALTDEAQATGEALADKLPLGAALMAGLGVEGAKVGQELGRVRTIADDLGTSGGLLAAEDRLIAMKNILVEIGAKTDADKAKLEALALGIGKGQSPEAGKRSSAAILGDLNKDRRGWERFALGGKFGALTNPDGSLNMDAAYKALEVGQQKIRKMGHGNAGLTRQIATNMFGSEQAGAAFLDMNVAAMRQEAATAKPSSKTAKEAEDLRKSEAGKAEERRLERERAARKAAEEVQPVSDFFGDILAKHPILGTIGLGAGGQLGTKALGAGARFAGNAVLNGFAGGGGGASSFTGLGGAGIGLAGAAGMALNLGAVGYATAELNQAMPQIKAEQQAQFASQRYHDARNIVRAVEHSGGTQEGFVKALGPGLNARASYDPALGSVAQGIAVGGVDFSKLPEEVRAGVRDGIKELAPALREAIEKSITISSDTEHPVTVNQAQSGGGMRN